MGYDRILKHLLEPVGTLRLGDSPVPCSSILRTTKLARNGTEFEKTDWIFVFGAGARCELTSLFHDVPLVE